MTKEQILQEFSVLDFERLERLYKYSRQLLIPEEDLLTNVTMIQMLAKANELADRHFPEWTDRGKSDFGMFLVELMALFSEKDFWYLNAYANESRFRNMKVYTDAFTKAISFGYDPVVCRGASATFTILFQPGSEVIYQRGELVVYVAANNLFFTNDAPFTVPASVSVLAVPVTLFEGTQAVFNVPFNGHNVFIPQKNVDVESIELYVNEAVWNRVRTFGRSGDSSPHFIALPDNEGKVTLFFGEDGFGKKPVLGDSFQVKYRVCKGSDGNIPITPLTINRSNSLRPAVSGSMLEASTGGSFPESLESLKNNAQLYFSSKKAAINAFTAEEILNGHPSVHKSKVSVIGNNVLFYVIPKTGGVASPALLTELQNFISPYLMLGYSVLGQATTYVPVSPVTVTVSLLSGYNVANTEELVRQLIEDYTNPLVLANYGDDFNLSDLSVLIRSRVPGVQNVVFDAVLGGSPVNVVVASTEIKQKILQANLTVTINVI